MRCLTMLSDPGPCPVDDTPHTACTSPDYRGTVAGVGGSRQSITIPVRRPRGLAPVVVRAFLGVGPGPVAGTFTTGTYGRTPAPDTSKPAPTLPAVARPRKRK